MADVYPTSVRLSAEVKAAVERAAKADDRSVSNLVERVLREWLVRHGHLKLERSKP
ncbi:ribbon-helix-helix protein, CopG family [Roseomonas terrae]|jgi:hypothetical protein|uniref:Ribbon-helix-helix protein, CopG family n=1 Tax=Neoroseomonas terrae TaxID=424799 RepID=A0ABS5EJJ2_9PROT|nr:ribbon-helix-helix protein, CopG family [Neoroseomonas terrae]MBR0651181.1 ribbon-helix-helix protein, CopG family [Neoroseomonas terrae]